MTFLENLGGFLLGIIAILVALFVYAVYTLGTVGRVIEYFRRVEGPGILKGIVAAIVVVCLLAFVASRAYAHEWRLLEYTDIHAGIDRTARASPNCHRSGIDDKLTSNVGIKQHIVGRGNVDLLFSYTHHSCVLNVDALGYDGVGFQINWRVQ